jgi:hypothetical protein
MMGDIVGFTAAVVLVVAAIVAGIYLGYRTSPWPRFHPGTPVDVRARLRRGSILTLGSELGVLPIVVAGVVLGLPFWILIAYAAAIILASAGALVVILITNTSRPSR